MRHILRCRLFSSPLMLFLLAVATPGCGREPEPQPAGDVPAPVAEPQVTKAPEGSVQSLVDIATEYEALQQQAEEINRKVVASLSKYQKRGRKLPPNFGPDLTDEQRTMLAERIQSERAGTRRLLQDIIDKDSQIQQLRAQMSTLGTKLPDHATAKEGDRHDRMAMDYLIAKGVSAQKAYDIVSQMNLHDALVPGFTVWTFYANGQFGTWVTKGSAGITPQEHQQRLAALLASERDEARRETAAVRGQLTKAQEQAKNASEESGALLDMLAKAESVKKTAEAAKRTAENTVRYSIGLKPQLVRMRVIDKSLKLLSFEAADLFSIDVGEKQDISVDAGSFNVSRIKRITLVPAIFTPGVDYRVQQDGPFARIRLLNLEKFKRNQFVIVIE